MGYAGNEQMNKERITMTHPTLLNKRFFPVAAILLLAVLAGATAFGEEASEQRRSVALSHYTFSDARSDAPVLNYQGSRSHYGWLMVVTEDRSDILRLMIWKDGTIVWLTSPEANVSHWYHVTVPAEKVEAALREITDDFAKYPSKGRERQSRLVFRLNSNYSPEVTILTPEHFEKCYADILTKNFYQENRDIFLSGDQEAILNLLKSMSSDGFSGFDDKLDYRQFVRFYRDKRPLAKWSEPIRPEMKRTETGYRIFPMTTDYSDEDILKCAALLTADFEHLLLMEQKISDLLPPREDWEAKQLDEKGYCIHVERVTQDGKSEYQYTQVSDDEERSKLFHEIYIKPNL